MVQWAAIFLGWDATAIMARLALEQPLRCRFTGRSFAPLFKTQDEYVEWSRYVCDPVNQFDHSQWMVFNGAYMEPVHTVFAPLYVFDARKRVLADVVWAARKPQITGHLNN